MGILSGNPKDEPMPYGDVYGTWAALLGAKGLLASHQTMINHAGDGDLKKILEEANYIKIKVKIPNLFGSRL